MTVNITYFVHGTTTDNEKDLATGWSPGELSDLGVEQSKKLKDLIANKSFYVVFCSDLKRAVDSANLAFGDNYKIIEDRRLREVDYGDYTRRPVEEFNISDYIIKPFPNGESYKDVEKRISDFLEFLKQNYDGKQVALLAHQGPQLALDVLIKGKTWKQAINEDWRIKKAWQPGWEYILE